MKTARGKDMWFHTKKAPGSHVVVFSEGADIPLRTQNEAAMLAVYHSSLKDFVRVEIDYTFVKNIKKTNHIGRKDLLQFQKWQQYLEARQMVI